LRRQAIRAVLCQIPAAARKIPVNNHLQGQAKGVDMRSSTTMIVAALAASLTGCGGGSMGGSGGGNSSLHAFVTPAVNSQRLYKETISDNQHNLILLSYTQTVTAVAADGSYTVVQQDPTNQSQLVDGTTYFIQYETLSINPSGQTSAYTFAAPGGVPITCTYAPNGPGPDFPVAVGETWTLDYMFGCGAQPPIAYVQNGTVADIEPVAVPAGNFTAIKLQSTISWTDALGTTRTQTVTDWRDMMTLVLVKESITIAYAGTLPNTGYPMSTEIVLQSLM
jgi:hypothetical protein